MVTNGENKTKKKKNKIKPYDVDESKKVFLFAYEYQLRNEKINWKKAEELKITKHSAGSMRSHYMNKIKNEISLYLEMYPEEVSKLFANAKKMKRMKIPEKTKNLSLTNNFAKQTSNISLNRLTKCGSIGAGFNKMNSLSIDKLFSSTFAKNKKKGRIMLGSLDDRSYKRRKENNEKEKKTGEKADDTTNINDMSVKDKETLKNDKTHVETKEKKINKNKKKKKKREKDITLKSTLDKTHKTLATQFPKELIAKTLKEEEEEEEEKNQEKTNKIIEKEITKNVENVTKAEGPKEEEKNVSKIFINKKDEISKNPQAKLIINKDVKKEMKDEKSALQNSIQNTEKKKMGSMGKKSESDVVNNIDKEEKKGTIASIFGYIIKKIFH